MAHTLLLDVQRRVDEWRKTRNADITGGNSDASSRKKGHKGGGLWSANKDKSAAAAAVCQHQDSLIDGDRASKLLQEKWEEFRALEVGFIHYFFILVLSLSHDFYHCCRTS